MIVYILRSEEDGSHYVGMSNDPQRRIKEHNGGFVKSTKAKRPWAIIYQEEYESSLEAKKREKYLKSAAGRRFRKNLGMYQPDRSRSGGAQLVAEVRKME